MVGLLDHSETLKLWKQAHNTRIADGISDSKIRISRVGQNCVYTSGMNVYLVISLPK